MLVGAVLALPVHAAEKKRFYQMEDVREIDAALKTDLAGKPSVAVRLGKVSERFLGTPYRPDPLGEGPRGEFDRDPLINFKAADCTTLVEQAMALAIACDLGRGVDTLQKIRYKNGSVSYETRNHFPDADWIPNNALAGYLRDITREIAGDKAKAVSRMIKKAEWYGKKTIDDLRGFENVSQAEREDSVRKWKNRAALFPDREVSVDYLPIESLPEFLAKIPSGTVANLIRENQPDKVSSVSHQVFIFDGPGGKIVRHAALNKEVMDVPALEYFYRYFNSSWKLLGLNLNAVLDPNVKRKEPSGAKP